MKRRVRKIANFFAFNLLFFALYLNFIHKDRPVVGGATAVSNETAQQNTAAFSGTMLVQNPEKYMDKKSEATTVSATPVESAKDNAATKLSIN